MKKTIISFILILTFATKAFSYPLDGFERTGINRLKGYYYAAFDKAARSELLPDGARLPINLVQLSLNNVPVAFPAYKSELSKKLIEIIRDTAPGASLSACDISNQIAPICGHTNGDQPFIAGSVGKIIIALALYHELSLIRPRIEDRIDVLKNRILTANEFVDSDTHEVPFWIQSDKEGGKLEYRPLERGDEANLWSFLDWMLSASSNGAANMIMREIVLMKGLLNEYPPSSEREKQWFSKTSPLARATLLTEAVKGAVSACGLSYSTFHQVSLFTAHGKELIPSKGSIVTTDSLAQFLFKLEQGKAIDFFTSLEMKRLLYLTQGRSRYGGAPDLSESAIYFKSGSLYKCKPEKGYECSQFNGNKLNLLNAAIIVETPVLNPKKRYLVAVSTNQLRTDAAELHKKIAKRIHQLFAAGRTAEAEAVIISGEEIRQ